MDICVQTTIPQKLSTVLVICSVCQICLPFSEKASLCGTGTKKYQYHVFLILDGRLRADLNGLGTSAERRKKLSSVLRFSPFTQISQRVSVCCFRFWLHGTETLNTEAKTEEERTSTEEHGAYDACGDDDTDESRDHQQTTPLCRSTRRSWLPDQSAAAAEAVVAA